MAGSEAKTTALQDCKGTSGSLISEPCNTGLYDAAIPMQVKVFAGKVILGGWLRHKITSFQQQLQLLYLLSCRCLEKSH